MVNQTVSSPASLLWFLCLGPCRLRSSLQKAFGKKNGRREGRGHHSWPLFFMPKALRKASQTLQGRVITSWQAPVVFAKSFWLMPFPASILRAKSFLQRQLEPAGMQAKKPRQRDWRGHSSLDLCKVSESPQAQFLWRSCRGVGNRQNECCNASAVVCKGE